MIFKFCPKCGNSLISRTIEKKQRLICGHCGFIYYQNSKPTAGAVLVDKKGRVLLAKRRFNPKKGFWDIPGGFLENGEAPEDGMKRELKEELGIKPKIDKLLGVFMGNYTILSEKNSFFTLNFYYLCYLFSGELKPMSDVEEFRWFGKNKIPFKKLAFKCDQQALFIWLKQK